MLRVIDRYLVQQPKWILICFAVILVGVLGFIDRSIVSEISFSIFYIIPILLATWYISRSSGIFLSIIASLVWLAADLADGHSYSHSLIPFWNAGVRLSFFLLITLLTSLVRKKLELEEALADTDYLTGLKNSRAFYERVESERVRSGRYGRPFTLAYIDIDNFKFINDTFGHNAGDEVLQALATAIDGKVRHSDVVSRLGGDEFGALFPETDFDASETIIQTLMPILTRAMMSGNWPVTFSIGAVTFSRPMDTTRDMIKRVDDLMYRVKKSGKNNIVHVGLN